MPRKTRFEIRAEQTPPEPGTEAFWRLRRTEASARRQMIETQHRQMMMDKMRGELVPADEVREMFGRVFNAYRQAVKEIDRRYGRDAAELLIAAERSALRVQSQEKPFCQNPNTPNSGPASETTTRPSAQSPSSRNKK